MHIVFVCLGNICRSPAAEGVFRALADHAGMSSSITCDSAGTMGYHTGHPPDPRMRAASARRGIRLDHRARALCDEDFFTADLIVTMDESNFSDAVAMAPTPALRGKVVPVARYFRQHKDTGVPDPYHGGPDGFDHVLDLLEDGCASLLEAVRSRAGPEP